MKLSLKVSIIKTPSTILLLKAGHENQIYPFGTSHSGSRVSSTNAWNPTGGMTQDQI